MSENNLFKPNVKVNQSESNNSKLDVHLNVPPIITDIKQHQQDSLVTEPFILPSNGKLYGDNFDGHITFRSMTTKEERM